LIKKEVNIFGNTEEKNADDNNNQVQNDEEDTDFIIDGKIVDANVNNNNNNNTNVNDQTWKEETNAVQYNTEVVVEEKKPKKAMAWGDNIKTTAVSTAKINSENMYFPDLNDKNAEKNAPKEKKNAGIKNAGLFGDNDTTGNTWGGSGKNDRFKEQESGIRFTNSKGNTEKLNKFMVKEGPTYDEDLGDDVEQKQDLEPTANTAAIKFSGKIKMDTQMTEADIQREKYLKEVQERAQNVELQKAQEKEEREANMTSEKPRFTNSKGGMRNNGLMMKENMDLGHKEEKRTFTNSKKVAAPLEPELDPNVPTASKNKACETKVTLSTWD